MKISVVLLRADSYTLFVEHFTAILEPHLSLAVLRTKVSAASNEEKDVSEGDSMGILRRLIF